MLCPYEDWEVVASVALVSELSEVEDSVRVTVLLDVKVLCVVASEEDSV